MHAEECKEGFYSLNRKMLQKSALLGKGPIGIGIGIGIVFGVQFGNTVYSILVTPNSFFVTQFIV